MNESTSLILYNSKLGLQEKFSLILDHVWSQKEQNADIKRKTFGYKLAIHFVEKNVIFVLMNLKVIIKLGMECIVSSKCVFCFIKSSKL